ncbi:MAG: DUF1801 domain-containing protein [Anaerolineae bacterium]|jgi:uncharacterized protein YdhG (YjbR/CyaY superfamily)|nr:DUF1801 domain-containing protein [Anaerolineae bacterium]
MQEDNPKPTNIDEYIAQYPADVQEILSSIRRLIHEVVPAVEEALSYGIPTFKLKGKNLVHFGAYKKHIGFYPSPSVIAYFEEPLSIYEGAKGSVKFPLNQPIPYELIRRMVEYRLEELNRSTRRFSSGN